MTIDQGTKLGPYVVASAVGAGGMGEVYRARDTRLDRTVAIKVLPSHLSSSPDGRERFEREARTVSQLSHPNICAVYDVGREGDTGYLVMEYLEGETLTARLARGPLPLEQALRIGAQLADALDQAHRRGIVHRDVKPGNVMLTRSGAKLLDFGLAKLAPALVRGSGDGTEHSALATQAHLTGVGTILGTVQYMSPEQLEGREADARTDIFALGTVLYEMVSGRKPFAAPSQASMISAIMSADPPALSSIVPQVPPLFERLVQACLAKDPDDRVQTAHDVLLQLQWIAESSHARAAVEGPAPRRRMWVSGVRTWVPWTIAALAIVSAAWLAVSRAGDGGPARARRTLRSTILLPERVALNNAVISPAGDRIAVSGIDRTGRTQIWVRPLDGDAATPLGGTEGGVLPFWSPDGTQLGFFADKRLKRIDASGGTPLALGDVDGVGGAWAPGGEILFSAPSGPILRINASGGQAQPVTTLNEQRGETAHRYPSMLPDGRHFLFLAMKPAGTPSDPAYRIWVASLDGGPAKPLVAANFNPLYADGHLLFIRGGDRGGSLMAQRFDPSRLETSGTLLTVAGQVALYGDYAGLGSVSASTNGTLLYDASRLLARVEWFDRAGRQAGVFGEPALRAIPRLSPDGTRVVYNLYDPGTQTTQVWAGDLQRGVESRLTSPPGSNATAIWAPDGTRIAYQSDVRHQADTYVRAADGSGTSDALTDEIGQRVPMTWSSDGRFVLVYDREPAGERTVGITAYPLDGDRKPFVVVPRHASNIVGAALSPDQRWLAYDTDVSGRREVHVVSFPDGKGNVQISSAGGEDPRWTRKGRELLYLSPDRQVMSVAIDTAGGMRVATPRPLFPVPEGASNGWDVSADGERFVFIVAGLKSSSVPLSLVQDWTAGLKQ